MLSVRVKYFVISVWVSISVMASVCRAGGKVIYQY